MFFVIIIAFFKNNMYMQKYSEKEVKRPLPKDSFRPKKVME
jgi:hypothetical protein